MIDMNYALLFDDLQKVLLAILLGGLIGLERESREKAAGIRTNIFICLGATLFTILSARLAGANDNARIAANIVTGIGFLGAGVIFRDVGRVRGLTTAALIWFVAAIGMSVGLGQFPLAISVTLIVMVILMVFPPLESFLGGMSETINYIVLLQCEHEEIERIEELLQDSGMRIRDRKTEKLASHFRLNLMLSGSVKQHAEFQERLIQDPHVLELTYS